MPYKDPEKERTCGRRRYERITAERIARGMCPRCGKAKPAPDRTLCRHCGEKRRKAERARCARAKAAGILYGGRDPERCREFARDRSRRRDRARRDARTCTRCGAHPPVEGGTVCEPCHVARRDREREQYAARRIAGLCGRCGTPAPSDTAYCDRCARSAAKRSRKKAKNTRSRQRYVQRRVRRLCIDCAAPSHGASRCPPCARRSWARSGEHRGLPVLPPRVHGHRDRLGGQSWDMGPVGRCSGLPGLRQAFPGPGGADPGYVEHRPVSGAGVRKLVAVRYACFREFAPLRLARPTRAGTVQGVIFGKCVATYRVLSDDSIYVCPATWTRHDPPRLAARHIESQRTAQPG